jgi:hypothetical protein
MSKRIRSQFHLLQVLKSAKPKLRKVILQEADRDLILAIVECVLNVLNGNCKLRKCIKRKLCKHKHLLRRLVDRSERIKAKRKRIIQKGGFLIPLLSTVLSGLTSLIRA